MLRPVQGSCGWEWAFEGKPNCFCTVGATESVSVNKAGMCWHITRGRGRSRQCWVAPQECKILPLLSQCTNVFWDRSVFYFLSRSYFGLDCKAYMVKVSYEQKPFRREVMRTYGAFVTPSPSMTTNVGRKILAEHPDTTGSLGCAISAAIDEALKCKGTGEEKTIVFGLTGTGYFDMVAYEKFHDGQMSDYIPTDADLQKGFDGIPRFPGNDI